MLATHTCTSCVLVLSFDHTQPVSLPDHALPCAPDVCSSCHSFSTSDPLALADPEGNLLQTLLTTGRADLCARDATNGGDLAIFAALKGKLNRAPMQKKSTNTTSGDRHIVNTSDQYAGEGEPTNPLVFPGGGEFHRRTGKIRRCVSRRGRGKAEAKGETTVGRDEQSKKGSDSRRGPDGLTAGTAKVKWFCGALERTAEKLSGRKGGGAEAFLLSVFEDFDR